MDTSTIDSIRRFIRQKSGISVAPAKQALVEARIAGRMRILGFGTVRQYWDFIQADPQGGEVIQLIDAISTNVTSFFREAAHFELLHELVNDWTRQGQRRFRIWSAAASSGEEPYSIAITLCEALADGADVRVLGTDISTKVLRKCLQATYTSESLSPVPSQLRQRYFSTTKDAQGQLLYRATDRLRGMLLFRRLNLSSPPFPMRGPLDLVFCRNVMIYFDNDVRENLVNEIYRLLKPGGYLLIGHAESLMGLSTKFEAVRPSVYKKV